MALKYSLKLFFLKCIIEFMINTAPKSSNSVNDGEKYIKYINFNTYRKIPKISPGANIFQRPFLRGLYSEGLIYGGKFTFQNR